MIYLREFAHLFFFEHLRYNYSQFEKDKKRFSLTVVGGVYIFYQDNDKPTTTRMCTLYYIFRQDKARVFIIVNYPFF